MHATPQASQAADTAPQIAGPNATTGLKPLRIGMPLLLLPCMVVARFVPGLVQDGPGWIWMVAFKAKTWNHLTLVGDRLYIRNAEEAVCYRLPVAQ